MEPDGIATRIDDMKFYVDWLFGKRLNYNGTLTRAATKGILLQETQ